jgi:hypothetical protein
MKPKPSVSSPATVLAIERLAEAHDQSPSTPASTLGEIMKLTPACTPTSPLFGRKLALLAGTSPVLKPGKL